MNLRNPTSRNHAFTLVELIVVIVIMVILAGLSAIAYRGIVSDLRLSSAKNTLSAALENARAMAIKKNRYVITVFIPRLGGSGSEQILDIVVAEWIGDSMNADRGDPQHTIWTYDRYVPIQGMQVRSIQGGINIGGPSFQNGFDNDWLVPTYLPDLATRPAAEVEELVGRVSGVLYNPEGRVVTRNSVSASDRLWVDFNSDGEQTWDPDPDRNPNTNDPWNVGWIENAPPGTVTIDDPQYGLTHSLYGCFLKGPGGEPFIMPVPFLSVFDEKEFRTQYPSNLWNGWEDRIDAYTLYIDANTDRIQFNRYSGVSLK